MSQAMSTLLRNTKKEEESSLSSSEKKSSSLTQLYFDFEKQFFVNYPERVNSTYESMLNFSDDLDKNFQRWYRYKEGFSLNLVTSLINKYSKNKNGIILDPFMGSGSTLIAANSLGYHSIGFEVNPFSFFLSKCKLTNYSLQDKNKFKFLYEKILESISLDVEVNYQLPSLSISEKVFDKEVEKCFMKAGYLIENCENSNHKIKDLLKLGWLSSLESLSNYRKAGNGLKIKKYVTPRKITKNDVISFLSQKYAEIYSDISLSKNKNSVKIYNKSCFEISNLIQDNSISGIIFSPPYANCFDYTEIYKLELWFGKFVEKYSDLKLLRNNSIHSHLNGDLNVEIERKSEFLNLLLEKLNVENLWDKKIPKMLKLYYSDMFKIIDECYRVLQDNGFCSIVVANSAYGNIVFPADLIFADYAKKIGFEVDVVEVDRYIITSSQQYKTTQENAKYLRESVVCLVKNPR